jgi:5-methylthioribose kinase
MKFEAKFLKLWESEHTGDCMGPSFYGNAKALQKAQKNFMSKLYFDSLGFMAAKMIR